MKWFGPQGVSNKKKMKEINGKKKVIMEPAASRSQRFVSRISFLRSGRERGSSMRPLWVS